MKARVVPFLFAALAVASSLLPLALNAQAGTITISGTAGSIPGGLGTSSGNNNVENNSTNLPAGYGGFTGPSNGSGWFFNGSVSANLASYSVNWYFLGAESGNLNSLFSVSPLFAQQEHNQNNNCTNCGSIGSGAGTFASQNSFATTFSTSSLIPLALTDISTGFVAINGVLSEDSIMYAYVTPNLSGPPGWTISTSATDWFALGWNDNGASDRDFDDFMAIGHVIAVPGPLAGAGLPGLLFAGAGLLIARWRRDRKELVASKV